MSSPSRTPYPEAVTATGTRLRLTAGLEGHIPYLLRPLIRAYCLGYAFTVGPRVFSILLSHALRLARSRGQKDAGDHEAASSFSSSSLPFSSASKQRPLLEVLVATLRAGTAPNRFPTFCAALVGGSTLLEPLLCRAFARLWKHVSDTTRTRLSRWLSSAIAAWFSIQLLQTPFTTPAPNDTAKPDDPPSRGPITNIPTTTTLTTKPQAGRTLDLTLFAVTRALDVIIGEIWAQRRTRLAPSHSPTTRTLDRLTSTLTDPLVFALASGIAMWHWFYAPQTLPRTYNKWIASAAGVDPRLVEALRRCRSGELLYGRDDDGSQAPLLQAMCADYDWPPAWGDPAVSVPFPCEMVHMGAGPSCELHAAGRFARAWLWSMKTYLPLQAVMLVARRLLRPSPSSLPSSPLSSPLWSSSRRRLLGRDVLRTLLSASRSSAFLGLFITLFYYSICLARTRVGPRVLGTSVRARQRIDSGLCVGAGCVLCGWSVLLESPGRRKELALFVAPRAIATMLPRRYDADREWLERTVFAASTAVVFTCVLENKSRVRGVLGGVLRTVLAA